MNQKTSRLFKFFSMGAVTLTVTAIAIFALVLASCAPIAENERMVVPYGYAKISVAVAGHSSGRAVTQGDKDAARLEIFFNGKSNGESTHGVFPVDSTVSIRVVGYNNSTGEMIGVGTTTHKMNRSNNVAHVTLGPVSGSYILRFSYGEAANLPGDKAGLPEGTEFHKGGEQGETPSGVTWTHGTLSGWTYNDESGSPQTVGAGGAFTMPNTATTLVAQWNATPYTINYTTANGNGNQTGQFTAKQSTVQLDSGSNFSNGGNVLTKWQANGEDFGSPNESVPVQKLLDLLQGNPQSVTLTAKWEALQTFAVTFDKGSQSAAQGMPQDTTTYNGGIISLAKPTVTGYDFKGWKVTRTDNSAAVTTLDENASQYTMPGEYAITLTAQWQLKTYSVTYSWGNGVSISTAVPTQNNVTHGSTFTVNIPNVTRTGYNFLGWSEQDGQTSNPTYKTGTTTSAAVTSAVTLYAVWEAKTYSVTYSWGSGVSDSDVTGAALPTQSNVTHGDTFTVNIPNVTRTGYDFLGWDTAQNKTSNPKYSSGGQTTSEAVTSAVTLYAVWGQKTYTVTYSWGNGVSITTAVPTQGNVTHGSTFTVNIPSVTRTGYNFLGWSESDGQTSNPTYKTGTTTSAAVTGAVTLYAVWEAKTYNITYNPNSGSGDATGGVTSFDITTTTVNLGTGTGLTRQGYNFAGWSNTSTGASVGTPDAETLISYAGSSTDITLYAVWQEMTELNVSASGNDTTGDGSSAKPFATLQKALEIANMLTGSNLTIKVNGTVEVSEKISFSDPYKTITLTGTNNGTLKRAPSASAYTDYFMDFAYGNVTLQNITLDGNKDASVTSSVPFIMVSCNGYEVTMESGAVIQNHKGIGSNAGAVRIDGNKFIMNGGSINSNENSSGANSLAFGGVGIYGGTFEMYGGSITNNTATGQGAGGVCLPNSAGTSWILAGGSITSNSISEDGGYGHGGVSLSMPDILQIGSTETSKNSTITITGNTASSSTSNLGVSNNSIIMKAAPATGSQISVTDVSGVFTSGWQSSWDKSVFTSDDTVNNIVVDTTGELKVVRLPQVGDVVMKDGTFKSASDTSMVAADAIAVVYKVDTSARKAWAMGKEYDAPDWCISGAQGLNTNFTQLQTNVSGSSTADYQFTLWTDGSTGLEKLQSAVNDAGAANLATNYPAWDYACNYGKNQGLSGEFATGWYLPSVSELFDIWKGNSNNNAVSTSLTKIGGTLKDLYWSSSQDASSNNKAYDLDVTNGRFYTDAKDAAGNYTCAVRQFTY